MFEGRGGMRPGDLDYERAKQLGQLLRVKECEAIVGAYGGLVRALLESGIKCHGHLHHRRLEEPREGLASLTDCQELVAEKLGPDYLRPEIVWAVRLGLMMRADAFVFFAGEEGTLAHLVPVLTLNRKRWGPEGRARKVALVGWWTNPIDEIDGLIKDQRRGLHLRKELQVGPVSVTASAIITEPEDWYRDFRLNQIVDVVDFLTATT